MIRSLPFALLPLLLPGGCGGSASDDETPAAVFPTEPIVLAAPAARCVVSEEARDLDKHACLHAESGPFARADASAERTAPSVSRAHTTYTVTVQGDARWVTYRPKSGGDHVFYTSPATRIAIRTTDGATASLSCEGATTGLCPALPYASRLRLERGRDVRVALFPENDGPVQLVVESAE